MTDHIPSRKLAGQIKKEFVHEAGNEGLLNSFQAPSPSVSSLELLGHRRSCLVEAPSAGSPERRAFPRPCFGKIVAQVRNSTPPRGRDRDQTANESSSEDPIRKVVETHMLDPVERLPAGTEPCTGAASDRGQGEAEGRGQRPGQAENASQARMIANLLCCRRPSKGKVSRLV
jgi:hypothetical protein